ncbi:MAG TPA: response regulator [Acidobacteriota bacterium]|nr:response regulator [Acidobacteriota bacterium]
MSRILLIDDEDMTRNMLRQALELKGYEVHEASNGLEALRLQRETPCSLVITDILMPEKEGLETIVELRSECPDLKIIAMSGGGSAGKLNFLDAAGKLGAQATLQKPFELEKLFKTVKSLMEAESA